MGKKIIKCSRNVLCQPNDKFWPSIQESESEVSILSELEKNLKMVQTKHPPFKWAELQKMNKEERAKKVRNFFKSLPDNERKMHEKAKQLRRNLAIGVNDVSRSLEKNELACCLVDGGAKPIIIITQLVQLAKFKKIPILIVNNLKKTSRGSIGFSTLAIGFMKEVSRDENHQFYNLCLSVLNSFKDFEKFDVVDNIEKGGVVQSALPEPENHPTTKDKHPGNLMDTDSIFTSLHLYRTSTNYRVFHPPEEESSSEEEDGMAAEVSVNAHDDVDECPPPEKKFKCFIEPNIVRIQSNPNKYRKNK